ncbi:DNA polymerase III subunit delta [Micromonospora sp. NBC_01412]|uniref:DNA polymerase III subunit delta n=1 Tax=Micromonospora sp. NBC_01412 TaxID=2903590 RepID=UPI003254B405
MGGVTAADLAPILLVLGDEELLATRAVAETVARARDVDPEVDVREYQAGVLAVGEIAEMLSPSLFGGRRVLVLRSGQDARKDLAAALLAYAKNPDPDVQLVVLHLGGAKGKAFADGLRAAGATVVPAAKLKGHRERVAFVRDEIRRAGGKCTDDAAEALIAAVGNDMRELAAACSQLIADTDGRIGADTVARYYKGRVEVSGFTVADATLIGDVPAALEALRWALHVGVDPVPIADALADGVRTVARVAAAGRGDPYQLAGALGMPAWKVKSAQQRARGWTPEGLVQAMRAAAECNAAVKGGADDRAYALERAVFSVAAARQGGAR